jgi:type I restriction enzyme, S subunit
MSLSFKYIPLTFLNDVNIIKEQIKNTVILRYLFDEYGDYSRLENLIAGTQYGYNASALQSGKNKFLRISDITDGKVNWDTVPFCDCSDENTYLLDKNDLLIARTGGTTGKSFIIDNPPEKAIFAGYLIRIRANQENNPEFLNLFLNSYVYWSQVVSLNKGEFRPSVNATKLKDLIVPKVDIEIQRDAINISKGISVAGYESLENNISKALNDFEKSQEIIEHFSYQGNNVELLKQSILQEAIQGKLTADWRNQNPNTEPASELLKHIKIEKAQLIKDKKSKKQKALPPISEKEIPFELPAGWVWVYVSDICDIYTGNSINKIEKEAKYKKDQPGLNYIGTKDVEFDMLGINYNTGVIIPHKETLSKFKVAPSKSVLVCIEGGSSGKKIGIIDRKICFGNKLLASVTYLEILGKYIYYYYNSPSFASEFKLQSKGLRGGVSTNSFKQIKIPIPPEKEVSVIIQKVEFLLKKCQSLKQEIKTSEANAQMLMQAVLKEAFEGKNEEVEV